MPVADLFEVSRKTDKTPDEETPNEEIRHDKTADEDTAEEEKAHELHEEAPRRDIRKYHQSIVQPWHKVAALVPPLPDRPYPPFLDKANASTGSVNNIEQSPCQSRLSLGPSASPKADETPPFGALVPGYGHGRGPGPGRPGNLQFPSRTRQAHTTTTCSFLISAVARAGHHDSRFQRPGLQQRSRRRQCSTA